MYENNGFVFGQHQVGRARQSFVVKSIAKPVRVEELADGQFGFGVLTLNARHIVAALSGGMYVGHEKR